MIEWATLVTAFIFAAAALFASGHERTQLLILAVGLFVMIAR
jgi:hypothetical protein